MTKLLLFLLLLGAGPALAQANSKAADPSARLFSATKGAKRRTNDKATFHKEHHPTGFDLHVHDPTKFHTAKGNRKFTYGKPGKNRKASGANKKPVIRIGKNRTTGR